MECIKIYDKHQNNERTDGQKNIIIGVHSYANLLISMKERKNIKIFIRGRVKQIVENILWNQFYSYTLLKDIKRTIFQHAEHKNSFLKLNGKTYRLNEILEWENGVKIGYQILRFPYFQLECFMSDSSVKFVTIELGDFKEIDFDLLLQYQSFQSKLNKSSINFDSVSSNRKNRVSSVSSSSKNKSTIKNGFAIKSLFQQQKLKQKNQNESKFLTQKKNYERKSKIANNEMGHNKKSSLFKNTKNKNYASTEKQNYIAYSKQSSNHFSSQTPSQAVHHLPTQMPMPMPRQELAATILQKKQTKIKQYRVLLEQKQKEHLQKVQNLEKQHQSDVRNLKKQVEEVLRNYKKKNKQLKKENQCLLEMNHKLSISNKMLEQKVEKLCQKMNSLQEGHDRIQKKNLQCCLKLETVQETNLQLMEKLNSQQANFNSQMIQKQKVNCQLKTKYCRLMSNLKMVALQQKENNAY